VKILFVYPNTTRQVTPQVGIASLMGALTGHEILLFDLTMVPMGQECNYFMREFLYYKPDLVLVSCRSNEWGFAKKVIELAYPTEVVVGGIHATICPDEVIAHAKYLIRGEGEGAVVDFVEAYENDKDLTAIPNVWVKEKGRVHRNGIRPLVQDLDSLPLPNWRPFDSRHFTLSYIRNLFPFIRCVGTFEASRGCPYHCSYCSNEFLQGLYKGLGSYHRKKSPQRTVAEIKSFKQLYSECNFLYFVDETFMIEEGWLKEFNKLCDKTPYVFMTRPEMVNEKKMKLVAESGGRAVSIGIESGNEEFRKKILNRKTTNSQILRAFQIAKDCGLNTYSFNMVGLPYETRDDILTTIELNKQIRPDIAQFTIFFPLKGTKLFDICVKEGYLKGEYPDNFNYYEYSLLKHPNFKKGELQRWVKKAQGLVKSN
jgi:radical SAM superfamily enzyme YgiQ (UPF0313 family)